MLTIYDIINKDINYEKEYKKIKDLVLNSDTIKCTNGLRYSYKYIFDSYIEYWKYRGTKLNIKEIISEIERKTNCGNDPINDCLYMCELFLNMREFIKYICRRHYIPGIYISDFDDKILLDTVEFLLKTLGYKTYKVEEYKILLTKEDADSINTALIVENEDISNIIMQYNDFKIVNNVKEKQKILQSLANYIEPKRKELKIKNSKLEKHLFMAFNKLNIRHNNLEGKEKEEYTSNLTESELLNWYDKTYNIILISIRLLELDNQIKPFEDIAKMHFNK